ncbi:hypothetical protein JCM13580A_31130 [Streptomyces drozdowiczii]
MQSTTAIVVPRVPAGPSATAVRSGAGAIFVSDMTGSPLLGGAEARRRGRFTVSLIHVLSQVFIRD